MAPTRVCQESAPSLFALQDLNFSRVWSGASAAGVIRLPLAGPGGWMRTRGQGRCPRLCIAGLPGVCGGRRSWTGSVARREEMLTPRSNAESGSGHGERGRIALEHGGLVWPKGQELAGRSGRPASWPETQGQDPSVCVTSAAPFPSSSLWPLHFASLLPWVIDDLVMDFPSSLWVTTLGPAW